VGGVNGYVIAFQKAGWIIMGQIGSHLVMTKPAMMRFRYDC